MYLFSKTRIASSVHDMANAMYSVDFVFINYSLFFHCRCYRQAGEVDRERFGWPSH